MAAPMRATSTPGVYARGSRWVAVYRLDGRQRKESAATFRAAREIKIRATANEAARVAGPTLHSYALQLITTPIAVRMTSSTIAPAASTGVC
jgi:hypothetical protein